MAGRGSFIESFPLFGYDLDDYDALFAEKLAAAARASTRPSASPGRAARHTPPIDDRGVYPRPFQPTLPIWIAVGGTPQSVVRAGALGLPLALAIIGGEPARFAPLFDLYRRAAAEAGHDAGDAAAPRSTSTASSPRPASRPPTSSIRAAGRGDEPHRPRARLAADQPRAVRASPRSPRGALFVGSPAEVTDKILAKHEIFGFDRFLIQMAIGVLDHAELMRAIELFGTRVAPAVRKAVAAPAL